MATRSTTSLSAEDFPHVVRQVEQATESFYQTNPKFHISKDSFTLKTPTLIERLFTGVRMAAPSPVEDFLTTCSADRLERCLSQPLFLATYARLHREEETELEPKWQEHLRKMCPGVVLGTTPAKQLFINKFFEASLERAYGDVSRIPASDLALLADSRSQINTIEFINSPLIKDATVDSLSSLFPTVIKLSLVACHGLTKKSIQRAIKTHPELEALCLSGIQIDHDVMKTIQSTCRSLTTLDLRFIEPDVSAEDIIRIVQANPRLSKIDLTGIIDLSEEQLDRIISSAPNLRSLTLAHIDTLSPRILDKLASIEHLTINECSQFTNETVNDCRVEGSKLTRLEIYSHKLTREHIEQIRLKFPYLRD